MKKVGVWLFFTYFITLPFLKVSPVLIRDTTSAVYSEGNAGRWNSCLRLKANSLRIELKPQSAIAHITFFGSDGSPVAIRMVAEPIE